MRRLIKLVIVHVGLIGAASCAQPAKAEESAAASEPRQASPDEVAVWIKDLDDVRYLAREEATQHLTEAGAASLDPLLAAANGDRPEPADRAIWILRRFSRSRDTELALAALDRLVQLQNRPVIVAKAESELAERSLAACEKRLGPLGADINIQLVQVAPQSVVPVLSVRLGERWHGTSEDMRPLSQLRHQRNFSLEGAAVADDVVRMFAEKEKLAVLHLIDTKVTPAAVDAVKNKHPDATVFVRNRALLGVQAEGHAAGVIVISAQPGSAAATAGIRQGDIIAMIDGHKIPDFDRLTVHIAQHQPGDKVEVEIIRNDERMKLTAVLGIRPEHE